MWSLSFEFWYYTIFGLWFYRQHTFKGLLLPLAACLVAGPKILLMMPLWLAGVMAYRLPRPQVRAETAWLLVSAGLLGAAGMALYLPPFPYGIGPPLFFAGQFLSDWFTGLFISLALWILPSANPSKVSGSWIDKFRKVADLTFPIYVLHYPLLILWQGIFKQRPYDAGQLAGALVMVLLVAAAIGLVLERQRPVWAKFFKWLLNRAYHAVNPTNYYPGQSSS
ncbi:hypothetical protein A8B98_18000 [Hymenobacter sp. UV11]|nr:hypothetical protein A8B98_18000 [Hymenobacter sp. UV11]